MMTPRSTFLAAALLTFATAACGGGKSDCEKLYDQEVKCDPDKGKDISKAVFVAACQAAKSDPDSKEEVADAIECSKAASCEAVETCQKGKRGKKVAGEITKKLGDGKAADAFRDCSREDYYVDAAFKAACTPVFAALPKLTGEDAEGAMMTCRISDDAKKASPEFAKACADMATAQLAAATTAATKARDEGNGDFKLCLDLKNLAEQAGGDAVAKAEGVCKELDATDDAKKAVTEARANAAAKKADLPFECSNAAENLAALTSDWGKATLTDVLKACYVELGAVLVEVKGADAKYGCPYELDKLKGAATTYKLAEKFPEFAAIAAAMPATCATN